MSDFGHLSDETAQLAARGNVERLQVIREDRWIDYPQATAVLTVLNEILVRPRTRGWLALPFMPTVAWARPCCCRGF